MKVKGQPVSKDSNGNWCSPNDHYGLGAKTAVEFDKYEVVSTVGDDIPPNDEEWPKGAPISDHYKVGNQIVRRIQSDSPAKDFHQHLQL